MSNALLLPLADCDKAQLGALLDDVFGVDRFQRTAYKLREGADEIAALSFGLVDGSSLVGSIQCWPVEIAQEGKAIAQLVLVGPVAVSLNCQNKGYGRRLMLTILSEALKLGDPPMVLIGDAEYYGLFGFSADATSGWNLPGPWQAHRLLARNPQQYSLPKAGMLEPSKKAY